MVSSKKKAQRTCLGCRQIFDQDRLVRYVLSPEKEILVDYRGKLPGRGAYTCLTKACVEEAVRKRQFERAFRGNNKETSAKALIDALGDQIRQRIENLVGMARKSGNIVSGSNMVISALGSPGEISLVLLSEDISSGMADKIVGKSAAKSIPCFRLFQKDALGQLVGKADRSVVALKNGSIADSLSKELLRYKDIVGEI